MLEQKGELQIKDLLLKLQVLTYGIIEERKKSQSYLQRIKEFEATLQKKDSEIVELTKAKFDLQSKLTLELSKKSLSKKNDGYISSLINKFTEKPADQGYVTELEEKINQLKFEVKDLTQRLMEEKETFDQQKIKRMRGKEKSKFQHQQKKKKNLMRNFFLKKSIFFCLQIFILTFLNLTYYIFSTVIKSDTRNDYLEKEDITDRTEGIYKYSLDIHLSLIENLTKLIDFVNYKTEFEKNGNVTVNDITYTDKKIFKQKNRFTFKKKFRIKFFFFFC